MLDELNKITCEVGEQLLQWRSAEKIGGRWYGSQLKTEADLRAHELLVQRLKNIDPGLVVISEEDEDGQSLVRPDEYFLIDPIDGTASYSQGFDGFVTQVAFMKSGKPALSSVYAPAQQTLYHAEKNKGAFANGQRLNFSSERPKRCILIDNYPEPRGPANTVFKNLPCTGYIECGGISLKMCKVADGSADIFFKVVTVRDWDVAAPALIVSEAGSYVSGLDNLEFSFEGEFDKPGVVTASSRELLDNFNELYRSLAELNSVGEDNG